MMKRETYGMSEEEGEEGNVVLQVYERQLEEEDEEQEEN